jgi:hypothetical protein
LPEWAEVKGVLQVLCATSIKFAKKARSVQLTEGLDLLNSPDLVVKIRGIVDTLESF